MTGPPQKPPELHVIEGGDRIEHARWMAVRGALSLEIKGLRRHGRSARILANEITGQSCRTRTAAYQALDDHIVAELGAQFSRPLPVQKQEE